MPTNSTRTAMLTSTRDGIAATTLITQRATFTVYEAATHTRLGQLRATTAEAAYAAWQREHGTEPVHIDEED